MVFGIPLSKIGGIFGGLGNAIGGGNFGPAMNLGTGVASSIMGMIPRGGGAGAGMANPYEINQPAYQAAWQMQQAATDAEAQALGQQAQIALQEAGAAAQIKARDVRQFREKQALQYQGQGVLLEGSPMVVLEDTRRRGQQEIDALLRRGAAQASLLRSQAMATSLKGRASLLGSQAGYGMQSSMYGAKQALEGATGGGFNPQGILDLINAFGNAPNPFKQPAAPPNTIPFAYPKPVQTYGQEPTPEMWPGRNWDPYAEPTPWKPGPKPIGSFPMFPNDPGQWGIPIQRPSAGRTAPQFQLPFTLKLPYGSGP